jgi:heptosyltransferase-2
MPHSAETRLIVAPTWLGDNVMAMPAVQVLRRRRPAERLVLLAKPGLAPLWALAGVTDATVTLDLGLRGAFATAARVRALACSAAHLLPNSTRSALIPWLARVPRRAGYAGHFRRPLLTDVVPPPPPDAPPPHQSLEYADILGVDRAECRAEPPRLRPTPDAARRAAALLGAADEPPRGAIAMLPGAARGPSKRWPAERFAAVGRELARRTGRPVWVLGGAGERELCARVAVGIGPAARDLSGRTALDELACLLAACSVAVTNDSGGMHLAAAAGARVVAIYGLTDPRRTGPLGEGHALILDEGLARNRAIARDSAAAERALLAIAPERVIETAMERIGRTT